MDCEHFRMWVSAEADGELTPAQGDALRAHLAGCAGCRDHVAALNAVRTRVRAGDVAAPAPAGLGARVRAGIDAAQRPKRAWFAAPVALAAGLVMAALMVTVLNNPDGAFVRDYQTTQAASQAMTAPGDLKPAFARELAFRPPVVDAAEVGCTLTGGRVAVIRGGDTAVLDYNCGGDGAVVYVNASADGVMAPRAVRHGDYRVVNWRGTSLACRAVSKGADEKTLVRLAAFIQKHAQET